MAKNIQLEINLGYWFHVIIKLLDFTEIFYGHKSSEITFAAI